MWLSLKFTPGLILQHECMRTQLAAAELQLTKLQVHVREVCIVN